MVGATVGQCLLLLISRWEEGAMEAQDPRNSSQLVEVAPPLLEERVDFHSSISWRTFRDRGVIERIGTRREKKNED